MSNSVICGNIPDDGIDIMGNIISLPELTLINKSGSLCYQKDTKIFFKILYIVYYLEFDHNLISLKFNEMFNNNIFLEKIKKYI